MTFIEAVKNIINSEWFQAVSTVLYPIVSMIFVVLVNVLKNKLAKITNSTDLSFTQINSGIKNVLSDQELVSKEVIKLKEQNQEMSVALKGTTAMFTSLLEVLSSIYLQSKAVDEKTKALIGKVVYDAKAFGLKVDDVIDHMEEQNKTTIEAGAKIAEQLQEKINEKIENSSTNAEDTEQKALSLYNDLIDQVGPNE